MIRRHRIKQPEVGVGGSPTWAISAAHPLAAGPPVQAGWGRGAARLGQLAGPPVGFWALSPLEFKPFKFSPFIHF